MKVRLTAAAGLVVLLSLAMASATGARIAEPQARQASDITVWLMGDAQSNWPEAVAAANQAFGQKHPGVDVKVQYQTWGDYKTKFEATLGAGNGPDVIEFGNTDTPKYTAAGALAPLNKARLPELGHLAVRARQGGDLQRQDVRRPVLRRSSRRHLPDRPVQGGGDQEHPEVAGRVPGRRPEADGEVRRLARIRRTPRSTSPAATGTPRCPSSTTSAARSPRRRAASGSARSTRRRRSQGLAAWRTTALKLSRANKTGDEAHPQQALVFAKGKVGSFVGNGWEWPYALDTKVGNPGLTGKIGAYPMPSHTKGQFMPTFLGGSVLGVPVTSKEKALAADWIAAFTSSSNMTTMAVKGGVIPNTTTLARINASKPTLAPFAEAAKASWFVPATPNWANVESANVLQSMLSGILRNPGKTQELAKQASDRITQILNAS